jgi:hypothetical protein
MISFTEQMASRRGSTDPALVPKNKTGKDCAEQSRRHRTKRLWPPRQKRSSLIVKITGAPMREMIDWIVGTDETVLDVAIDGLIALSGASFLTGVLHVVIKAL